MSCLLLPEISNPLLIYFLKMAKFDISKVSKGAKNIKYNKLKAVKSGVVTGKNVKKKRPYISYKCLKMIS